MDDELMNERRDALNRNEITGIYQRLARIEAMLGERCRHRGEILDDHERRIGALEVVEHRRNGGMAVMAGLLAASAALGGLIAKFWPVGTGH